MNNQHYCTVISIIFAALNYTFADANTQTIHVMPEESKIITINTDKLDIVKNELNQTLQAIKLMMRSTNKKAPILELIKKEEERTTPKITKSPFEKTSFAKDVEHALKIYKDSRKVFVDTPKVAKTSKQYKDSIKNFQTDATTKTFLSLNERYFALKIIIKNLPQLLQFTLIDKNTQDFLSSKYSFDNDEIFSQTKNAILDTLNTKKTSNPKNMMKHLTKLMESSKTIWPTGSSISYIQDYVPGYNTQITDKKGKKHILQYDSIVKYFANKIDATSVRGGVAFCYLYSFLMYNIPVVGGRIFYEDIIKLKNFNDNLVYIYVAKDNDMKVLMPFLDTKDTYITSNKSSINSCIAMYKNYKSKEKMEKYKSFEKELIQFLTQLRDFLCDGKSADEKNKISAQIAQTMNSIFKNYYVYDAIDSIEWISGITDLSFKTMTISSLFALQYVSNYTQYKNPLLLITNHMLKDSGFRKASAYLCDNNKAQKSPNDAYAVLSKLCANIFICVGDTEITADPNGEFTLKIIE